MKDAFVEEVLSYLPSLFSDNLKLIVESCVRKALVGKLLFCDTQYITAATNEEAIKAFLAAKSTEGCSSRTIKYYETTLHFVLDSIKRNFKEISTDDIRSYFTEYKKKSSSSGRTQDNMRRILSSFFNWLEEENLIARSPMKRIKKIRFERKVKSIYTEEVIEKLREAGNPRDVAIIDFLYSTGVRVGELVKLNKSDIDFENKECTVRGKGNKQRKVYFDARTKLHLEEYLTSRNDDSESLFVSLDKPHKRLEISGVESSLKKLGKKVGINNVHPHKFRRSLATKAIDKGMPIEQVQRLLGHSQLNTTLEYAMVDDNNVKISHKKYLG